MPLRGLHTGEGRPSRSLRSCRAPRWRPAVTNLPAARLDRRTLLRNAGLLGLGAVAAACGGGDPSDATSPTSDGTSPGAAGGTPIEGDDATAAALEAAGVDAPVVLTPIIATFEVLTGGASRVQFGLLDESNSPILDADVEAFVVRSDDATLVQGPVSPIFFGEDLGNRGVYVFEAELSEPGIHDLVVVTADGRAGTGAMQVITPEQSAVARPGQAFPIVETPTTEDPKDLAELCTREPDCGMHETSLDTALAEGRPIVFTIATPKYCQTAVCGPVVDVVLEAKKSLGRDDIAFIHAEVFTDAGNTPTEVVTQLQLPTEPWTFVIDADGNVADRFDGPVVPQLLHDAIETHL